MHGNSSQKFDTQFSTINVRFIIYPLSILHKSIAGRYRPVRVADGPITARCRFIKNASWVHPYFLHYTRIYLKLE